MKTSISSRQAMNIEQVYLQIMKNYNNKMFFFLILFYF